MQHSDRRVEIIEEGVGESATEIFWGQSKGVGGSSVLVVQHLLDEGWCSVVILGEGLHAAREFVKRASEVEA